MLIITVGHRPFPVQLAHAAGQCSFPADKMADQKRSGSLGESSSCSKRSKRQVTVATCEKWQREFDRDYQTLLWLRCDVNMANRSLIDTLWCDVCRIYQAKIRYKRNFSAVWVTGSTNHKSSNVVDHGKSMDDSEKEKLRENSKFATSWLEKVSLSSSIRPFTPW